MKFLRTLPGAIVLVIAFAAAIAALAVGVRVWGCVHPIRIVEPPAVPAAALVRIDDVRFPASDGIDLAGWRIDGRPGMPAVILCHDLGASKASLLPLALAVQQAGFTVLTFDFRGHGESGGVRSTLGIEEKRDVLGAVDFLLGGKRAGDRLPRIGIYGVGLGAHAAALAAVDRQALRVVVLDSLYPDAGVPLARKVFGGWTFGERELAVLPRLMFALITRESIGSHRAADALPRLAGRDVLMLSPAGDARLAEQIQAMYGTLPEGRDADGNLVTLPATGSDNVAGEDQGRYRAAVTAFLSGRLGRS